MLIDRCTRCLGLATAFTVVFVASCSNGDQESLSTGSTFDSKEESSRGADGDEPHPLEGLRGAVSPAEFERFDKDRGLIRAEPGATPGLTVVMPLNSTEIHLVDEEAAVVHTWSTGLAPGGWCYLADDGTLYRGARQDEDPHFKGGGIGGVLQRLAPDGTELWRYEFANETRCQHHDLEVLPNGNVLLIAWERKSAEEAIARGRDPRGVGAAGLWADAVFEIRPVPPTGGEIVWSWHVWDHLVQDRDESVPNFAPLHSQPGRIDVNANFTPPSEVDDDERRAAEERARQMAALGYGGGGEDDDDDEPQTKQPQSRPADPEKWDKSGDWMHTNAIDWNAELDLIVLSSPELGEVLVIDHSLTTEEAKTARGDVLWRWGNPLRYGLGGSGDQRLFYQHDPQWLDVTAGDPPRLLVFNNGGGRPDGASYSEVLELELPFDPVTGFSRPANEPFGPSEPRWSYSAPDSFFSAFISGASRLASGNTLICSGAVGRIFEVTPTGGVVWDYFSTHGGEIDPPEHAGKAPPFALYRAARYSRDHPGIVALRR